jgi:hypothetical protein
MLNMKRRADMPVGKSLFSRRFKIIASALMICTLSAVVLVASRRSVQPDAEVALHFDEMVVVESKPTPKKTTARTAPKTAASRTSSARSKSSASKTPSTPATLAARPVAADVNDDEPSVGTMTITGCLERDDNTFRLKDTDAPKSRNWKSGFLKKGAKFQVVDASNRFGLRSHVGHRVSVTGVVNDRTINARSFRMVKSSC